MVLADRRGRRGHSCRGGRDGDVCERTLAASS